MKSKQCSYNLQSNHRGNSQQFCKMLMSRLINLRHFYGQKTGIGSCQKHQRKRHMEKLTSVNLQQPYSSSDRERKEHSHVYTLHKTLNLHISHCCFAEVLQVTVLLIRACCSTLHPCCTRWTNYHGKFSCPFQKPLTSGSLCKL